MQQPSSGLRVLGLPGAAPGRPGRDLQDGRTTTLSSELTGRLVVRPRAR